MFTERSLESLRRVGKNALRTGAAGILAIGASLAPHPIRADDGLSLDSAPINRVILTPPEGSVTPNAGGWADLQLVSYRKDIDLAEVLVNGHLTDLVPERTYKFWICWKSEGDCSTFAYPKIITDHQGTAYFEGLNITVFNRPKLPVASVKVIEETSGRVPDNSCFVSTNPCLRAPYSIPTENQRTSTEIRDNGVFPQCTQIKYMPEENLNREPVVDYPEPFHPQIKHAIDTLNINQVFDLMAIDLVPQGTKMRFVSTVTKHYCLPDQLISSRFAVQTGEGAGVGLPTGGREDGLVELILPEGVNPIVLRRMGQRFPGSSKEEQEWLFLNLQPDEEVTFRNSDGSFTITSRGPMAIQTATPGFRLVEFIQPDSGFADDKPLPIPN